MNQVSIELLKSELIEVTAKINKLNGVTDYTDRVARHFPLGMVGGSGRNTASLNRKRERALDKTIERSKILIELSKRRNSLEAQIKDIETGGPEFRAKHKHLMAQGMAQYWKGLKVGDQIPIGNGVHAITKKSAKSLYTGDECKWTAAEIIGRAAAALL